MTTHADFTQLFDTGRGNPPSLARRRVHPAQALQSDHDGLCPSLLQKGVYVRNDALATILEKLPDTFWSPGRDLRLDAEHVSPEALKDFLRSRVGWIHFSPAVFDASLIEG
jgi:hypothetical protein